MNKSQNKVLTKEQIDAINKEEVGIKIYLWILFLGSIALWPFLTWPEQ